MNQVRPRGGWVDRIDGSRIEVRFIPTADPDIFLAVTVDGEPAYLERHDTITADILGPGQRISVTLRLR